MGCPLTDCGNYSTCSIAQSEDLYAYMMCRDYTLDRQGKLNESLDEYRQKIMNGCFPKSNKENFEEFNMSMFELTLLTLMPSEIIVEIIAKCAAELDLRASLNVGKTEKNNTFYHLIKSILDKKLVS